MTSRYLRGEAGEKAKAILTETQQNQVKPLLDTPSTMMGMCQQWHTKSNGKGLKFERVLLVTAIVVGGLISSTLLTLFMLPTLYKVFERSGEHSTNPLPDPPSTLELHGN